MKAGEGEKYPKQRTQNAQTNPNPQPKALGCSFHPSPPPPAPPPPPPPGARRHFVRQQHSDQPAAGGRGKKKALGRGLRERSPGPTEQQPMATAGPAQAPAPPRPSRHSQFRISEMKTARPRIPSPFDTAGIVARDHGHPTTHQTATTTTAAAARSPRGALQAAAAASAARRRREGSRAPAGGGRAKFWRHLPRGGGRAADRAGPPLRRRGGQRPWPLPRPSPAGTRAVLRSGKGGCLEAGPRRWGRGRDYQSPPSGQTGPGRCEGWRAASPSP